MFIGKIKLSSIKKGIFEFSIFRKYTIIVWGKAEADRNN